MEVLTGINEYICKREKGDPKFYGVKNAKGESNFLYLLQQYLNKRRMICMNYNGEPFHIRVLGWSGEEHLNLPKTHFIKKRMHKDGNLVDELQQYIRTANPVSFKGKKYYVALYNDHWAVRGLEQDWNEGEVKVRVAIILAT